MMALPKEKRLKIVELIGKGLNNNQISIELGISRPTVKLWRDRYNNTGTIELATIPGRPKCSSRDTDIDITARVEATPFISSTDIYREGIDMSTSTIRRRLRESGIKSRVAAQKELISELNKTRRLLYASQYFDGNCWSDWEFNTIFVDESIFASSSNHKKRVYRRDGMRYDKEYLHFIRGCGWTTVSVFGGLCGDELLPLYLINGHFNATQYADVMEQLYWPVIREKFQGREFRFQEDNSQIHRSVVMKE